MSLNVMELNTNVSVASPPIVDGAGKGSSMTLTELSVYMKEQEQLRTEKEREEGENQSSTLCFYLSPVESLSLTCG